MSLNKQLFHDTVKRLLWKFSKNIKKSHFEFLIDTKTDTTVSRVEIYDAQLNRSIKWNKVINSNINNERNK